MKKESQAFLNKQLEQQQEEKGKREARETTQQRFEQNDLKAKNNSHLTAQNRVHSFVTYEGLALGAGSKYGSYPPAACARDKAQGKKRGKTKRAEYVSREEKRVVV